MAFSTELQKEYDCLNPEQQQAVDSIDGPILVVAGPGTGKTQLLSLRVANILDKQDIQAANILCLTFTEAGAEAMQKRLVSFIGRDAYAVQISTFHSFAQLIRSNYPEFFERSAFDSHITNLQAKKLIETLLSHLDYTDPLYQKPFEGNYAHLGSVAKLIGNFKKAGLAPSELREIINQNLEFFDYASQNTELLQMINAELPRAAKQKQQFLDDLQFYVSTLLDSAPVRLKTSVVKTPGIYSPYICYFIKQFMATELYQAKDGGGAGQTAGYQELRKTFFIKDKSGNFVFKDFEGCQKLLSTVNIFEEYLTELDQQALYDYDDMILDAIAAIETNPQLQAILQDQYKYLLVDEFQDTNGSQMRLLDLIGPADSSPNILAVGDDDQAIMRFQGASVEYLKQFEQHYHSVQRIVLQTNYRSTPKLVELGQKVAVQVENRSQASLTEKKLQANKPDVPSAIISAKQFYSKELQYYELAKAIKGRIDAGFIQNSKKPNQAIAVIASKHGSLRALIPYLRAFDIAYNYRVTTQLTQIASLQTLFALMHFVTAYANLKQETANSFLPQIMAAPEFGIAAGDYFNFALRAKQQHADWLELMQKEGNREEQDLANWLTGIAKQSLGSSARQIISQLAKPLGRYYQAIEDRDPFATIEFNYGVKKLLDFALEEYTASQALGATDRPMLLKDVLAILKDVGRFKEEVNISIPVERADAITLTSAHGSKGLEYDLVYLIDVDKKSWVSSRSDSVSLSQNMFFGTVKDIDDARRLLFVALTRASFELEISLGSGEIVPELLEELIVDEVALSTPEIAKQSQISWESNYYPHNPQLLDLLRSSLSTSRMSASLLNKFLDYNAGDPYQSSFVLQRLVSLPGPPEAALEFGNCIHSFFEEYLNKTVLSGQKSLSQIIKAGHQAINNLDFEADQLDPLLKRFDLIVEHFLPQLSARFANLSLTYQPERSISCVLDGIPLTGRCDLLELDNQAKTIQVLDYKTGKPNSGKPDRNYLRQLQFYKLLIEASPEYLGWTVLGGADLFVEPQRPDWSLAEPQFISVDADDLEHLATLIQAVWERIKNVNFNVEGFAASSELTVLKNSSTRKNGPTKAEIQEAFEFWLIADFLS